MELVQQIAVNSDCYKANRQITPQGIVLHSVGCPQPRAEVFANTWNKAGQKACVHAVLDNNGKVIQCLPWNWRGWHVGGSGNNTHIGVEMTEPSTIKYTGGAKWEETGDGTNTLSHVMGTYKTAIELFAYLCTLYKLNPLKDGVIISHHEANVRGIGSNHGDVEHIWNKLGLSMDKFRQEVYNAMDSSVITKVESLTPIMGIAKASKEQVKSVMSRNKVAQKYIELVDVYYKEGEEEGVRGDIAIAQSCLETGWFTFKGDVKEEQNNYAGLGTTGGGVKGCYFETPEQGVRAQIQHLKAYASKEELKNEVVDPRFNLVSRGSAENVEWLGQQENPQGKGWATGKNYGAKVLNILNSFEKEEIVSGIIEESETTTTTNTNQNTTPAPAPSSSSSSTASSTTSSNQNKVEVNKNVKYVARLSYEDEGSQIGCYNVLSNAILKVEEYAPYKIYSTETKELIYESCYSRYGRPKAFKIEVLDKQKVRESPNGKEVGVLEPKQYEVAITYSQWGLIIGYGWVNLAYVKIYDIEENDEIVQDNKTAYIDNEGNATVFTNSEWEKLVKIFAYTGKAEEVIQSKTIEELRVLLKIV